MNNHLLETDDLSKPRLTSESMEDPRKSVNDYSLIPENGCRNILEVLSDAKQLLEIKQEMLQKNINNLHASQIRLVNLMNGIKERYITYPDDDLAKVRLNKLQMMTSVFEKMDSEIEESLREMRTNNSKLILLGVDIARAKVALRNHTTPLSLE